MTNDTNYQSCEQRWEAVLHKDQKASGIFVYAVLTTGIYCRPGCSSRCPRQENVLFFDTPEEAERAGYRPCKRCRPKEERPTSSQENAVLYACQLMDASDRHLGLQTLAKTVGLSPFHLHRLFRRQLGITPKQYSSARQSKRFQKELHLTPSITEAIYAAGFSSSGPAYAPLRDSLGMSPSRYRKGGEGAIIHYETCRCPLGWLLVGLTDRGICAIELADSQDGLLPLLKSRFPLAELRPATKEMGTLVQEVVGLLVTPKMNCDLPLDLQGTAFQIQVWGALRSISKGQTISYSALAERIGKPKATRAVARAVAENRLAVAIPCHRVIGKGGKLTGYRWGIDRKRQLLEMEQEHGE